MASKVHSRILISSLGLWALLAWIQAPYSFGADYQSPRTAALGGASHAAPMLNDAIYLNPSYTSFLPITSTAFAFGSARTEDGSTYNYPMNASIMDGHKDAFFQAGVGFTRLAQGNFFHVGASKSPSARTGFGAGTKFFMPTGSTQVIIEPSVSGAIQLTSWLQGALIVDNLLESPAAVVHGMYREITLGTKLNVMDVFTAYVDPHFTPALGATAWGYEAGLEFPFFKDLYLRAGAFRNANVSYLNTRGDGWAVGAGWTAPRISFDYAMSRTVTPVSATQHLGAVSIFF